MGYVGDVMQCVGAIALGFFLRNSSICNEVDGEVGSYLLPCMHENIDRWISINACTLFGWDARFCRLLENLPCGSHFPRWYCTHLIRTRRILFE